MKKRWLIALAAALVLTAAAVALLLPVFHHPAPDTPAGHVIAHMGGGGAIGRVGSGEAEAQAAVRTRSSTALRRASRAPFRRGRAAPAARPVVMLQSSSLGRPFRQLAGSHGRDQGLRPARPWGRLPAERRSST